MSLTSTDVINDIKKLLDIDDTVLYDDKLNILINGAFSKMKNEGVPNVIEDNQDIKYFDYIICLSYQVAIDIDIDVDISKLQRMYFNRILPLREMMNNVN